MSRSKHTARFGLLLLASMLTCAQASAAYHTGKRIKNVFPGDRQRPCIFFTLDGVATADPAVSTSGWFSLPPDHPRFKEIYAFILAIRASGEPINVGTTGAIKHVWRYSDVTYVETSL